MQPSDVSASVSSKNGSASQNGIGPTGSETPPLELPVDRVPEPHSSSSSAERDPYVGVVLVLLAASIVGLVTALEAGLRLGNPILIDTAVTLGLAAGIPIGIARAQLPSAAAQTGASIFNRGASAGGANTPSRTRAVGSCSGQIHRVYARFSSPGAAKGPADWVSAFGYRSRWVNSYLVCTAS